MNNIKFVILKHKDNDITKKIYNVEAPKCAYCGSSISSKSKYSSKKYDNGKCIKDKEFCSLNCAKKYQWRNEKCKGEK